MAVQSAPCYEAFDLGMGDWTDEPEETSVQPPPPKKRLRLSWQGSATSARHHKSPFCWAREYWGARERSQRGCSDEHRSCYSMGCRILRAGHVAGPPLLPMRFRLTC